MSSKLIARIDSTTPKKILTCDGGGILGLISVEILTRIESDLRTKLNKPDLVLADWFDFVCGTSTGAIIATCIAAGMTMEQIRQFYVSSGEQMFDKASVFKRLRYSYNDEPLAEKLRGEFNRALGYSRNSPPATLGDVGLRTLLMMVLRNHTTDSPWPVSNNPRAMYNQRFKDDGSPRTDCNLDLPLWQLVRASTAAPTFFPPEVVTFAPGTPDEYQFIFVDGGVTTYNNPAFLAFQMATAAPYKINWATGTDNMLIVSVGTGSAAKARPGLKEDDMWLLDNAKSIPSALMNAASAGWDLACRILGECRHGGPIDREVGDLVAAPDSQTWTGTKQFAYVRYDPDVSREGLFALGLKDIDPARVQLMDSVKFITGIHRVGEAYAAAHVNLDHFKGFV
ncbi:patatin-like phospholipase family protein [Propionivibrio sp.]|uniref:patatin-like phospholipase family protein n=1 Tax=Propionivibrio sp. TaxID=2212460 RepID=UPI0025DC2F83|nr:patatin-like phospholipase family protein [Propionivibrio sp.]MBK8744219.1 patatin-like phospholipase family protein [Propionivibrio sp.]